MGLFDKIFGSRPKEPIRKLQGEFRMLSGYTPRFTSFAGGLYESELIRSAINANATHISKLKVEFTGSARPELISKLTHEPNQFQTWSQFLRRLSTMLDVNNTAFIVPTFDQYGEITGIFTPLPSQCEIIQYDGEPWLRYTFQDGTKAALEMSSCGIMVQHQYSHDLMGENNHALFPTMELINIQNQGIEEGVKSAATYRFMAQLSNFSREEDLKKERKRFTEENFSREAEGGGLLLFPNTYENIKQVEIKPWVVDSDQMKIIKENVYEYFGVNEEILTNKAIGDAWLAYFEGKVEPFEIQLSEVMTRMLYSTREQSHGNRVMATANRLQYMSNKDKLQVSSQLLDRGILSLNDVRDIWNLPPVDGGDRRIIRGEYYDANEKIGKGMDDGNNE